MFKVSLQGQPQNRSEDVVNAKEDSKEQNQNNDSTGSEEKPLEVDEKENLQDNSVVSSESKESFNKRSLSSTESADAVRIL